MLEASVGTSLGSRAGNSAGRFSKRPKCATITAGMARTRVLSPEGERQLGLLVGAGVTVATAAGALGVSTRTAQRVLARQRAEPETLEELIASLPTPEEALAAFSVALSPVRVSRRRRSGSWRTSAEWLEAERPESWSLPADRT